MTFDPISQDPPHDPDFPATSIELSIESHGATLHGVMYRASGGHPHPLILLLHGIPGHERNFDLAHILRRAGYHVAVVHYRGSWGSGGNYRLAHVLEDVEVTLEYLKQPEFTEAHRIDPERMTLIGHSLGGWASLMSLKRGLVTQAVAIASANFGLMGVMINEEPEIMRPMTTQLLAEFITPLQGVTAQDLLEELETYADAWDYTQHITAFADCRLHLISASQDEIVPTGMYHHPFVSMMEKANTAQLTHIVMDTDHSFSDKRVALARDILAWLQG